VEGGRVKIVARLHAYPPDCNAGAEMMAHSMFRALVEAGHSVTVCLTRPARGGHTYMRDGVVVAPRGCGVDDEREVRSADVVITHLEAAPHTIRLCEVFNKPLVQILHNDFNDTTRREIERRTSLYVYNSHWLRDSLGAREPHIICRPPVYAEDYRTTPGDRVTLVNLCAIKGVDVFWSLVKRMRDVEFLGVKGGYATQQVLNYPNADVLNHTTDMRSVYAQTRILLMPSTYDSWGRVAVEAMCSGIPVIATDDDWSRESIGDAGVLLGRTDLPAWEAAIRTLLEPDVYTAAQVSARQRADELEALRVDDLARFVDAVEALADRKAAA
jgi:glycosyltransferase involved in cell wall biosynthesis